MNSYRYPSAKKWLTYKYYDNKCIVSDYLTEDDYPMSRRLADFLRKLDGKTDPHRIDPSLDDWQVKSILKTFNRHQLLRRGRFLYMPGAGALFTIYMPKWTPAKKQVCAILNGLLMLFWLPVLLFGIWQAVSCPLEINDGSLLAGFLGGMLVGMVLHELGHGIAGAALGAKVFELGVRFALIPGAYTLMDESIVKSRRSKIQIYAAGVEMNFLLAGICLIITVHCYDLSACCFMAAYMNIILGCLNLLLSFGIDGMRIFENLFATDDLFSEVWDIVTDRDVREKLRKKGAWGNGLCVASYFLAATQLALPILILSNLWEVITWLLAIFR